MSPAREDYCYAVSITTRWEDNDMHGHVNNVEYYSFFDTVVTTWLLGVARHDVRTADVIGLCVQSRCDFHGPLTFPDVVDACLRVADVGRTSVRYEIGLFRVGSDAAAATGEFTHVYVDREDRRPREIPSPLREALASLAAGAAQVSR